MDDERDGAGAGELYFHGNNDSAGTDNLPPMERAMERAGRYMDDGPPTPQAGTPQAAAITVGLDETFLQQKRVAYQLLHSETDIDRVTRIVAILMEGFTMEEEEDEESDVGHQP